MLSTAVVQHGVKKFTPVSIFTLSMILLGTLVNKFPPEEENVVIGKDFFCNQFPARNLTANVTQFSNFTSDNRLLSSFGLSAVALVLPLMPLVIPVLSLGTLPIGETRGVGGMESGFRNQLENFEEPHASAKNELNRIALRFALQLFVGQASCFGSTELAKHFIVNPDETFFEKCRLTRNACRALESYNLLVFRVGETQLRHLTFPCSVTTQLLLTRKCTKAFTLCPTPRAPSRDPLWSCFSWPCGLGEK